MLLRVLMTLYIPFLILFWVALGGLILLLAVLVNGGTLFMFVWVVLLGSLVLGFIQTLWAARVALLIPRDETDPLEIRVPAEGIPELWGLTKRVAAERSLPLPDEIRLHPATVAHVYEDKDDRRILVLGGPSLTMLSERALAGVIAHELGHFGAGDTTLAKAGYRRARLMGALEHGFSTQPLSLWNPLVWVVRGYHWLYLFAYARHSREQEFAADRHDAAQAGKEETAAAPVYLDVLDELPWTRLTSVLHTHAATGTPLDQMFDEQRQRARSITRSEWEEALSKVLRRKTAALDSHPCLKERLKAVGVSPKKALGYALERTGPPIADRLRAWPGIEKRLTSSVMALYRQVQLEKLELAQIVVGGPVGR